MSRSAAPNCTLENISAERSSPLPSPCSTISTKMEARTDTNQKSTSTTAGEPPYEGYESEIHRKVLMLVAERDRLDLELCYTRESLGELGVQIAMYENLLTQASNVAEFYMRESAKAEADAASAPQKKKRGLTNLFSRKRNDTLKTLTPGSTWIRGSWLSQSFARPFLGDAEAVFNEGRHQDALIILGKLLGLPCSIRGVSSSSAGARKSASSSTQALALPIPVLVLAKLLLSTIHRETFSYDLALLYANEALAIAQRQGLISLVSTCNFYRGIVFYFMGKYPNASWCFTLASWTPGYVDQVAMYSRMAEAQIEAMTPGYPGRLITEDVLGKFSR